MKAFLRISKLALAATASQGTVFASRGAYGIARSRTKLESSCTSTLFNKFGAIAAGQCFLDKGQTGYEAGGFRRSGGGTSRRGLRCWLPLSLLV